MIQVSNLHFGYETDSLILKDISFALEKGKVLGLLGHNGSGKSTLLKLLAGLYNPNSGKIEIESRDLQSWERGEFYKNVGYVIEKPAFYGHLTLADNFKIQSGYRCLKLSDSINQLGIEEFINKKVKKLSTGMRQRAGIISATFFDPRIVFLDEPTSGLDPEGVIQVREFIDDLKVRGKTLIVSSHVLSEIEKISDELLILKNGEILFHGNIDEVKKYRDLESMYIELQNKRNVEL